MAEYAAEYLNADLYDIMPEEPYTEADLAYYTDCRADREQNDPDARPKIVGSVENMSGYDKCSLATQSDRAKQDTDKKNRPGGPGADFLCLRQLWEKRYFKFIEVAALYRSLFAVVDDFLKDLFQHIVLGLS